MFLKELVSWLIRGQNGPFLREICPLNSFPAIGEVRVDAVRYRK
jgi:hypothetical protein